MTEGKENPMEPLAHPGVATLGDIVTITVGHDGKLFKVHKNLLCHYSEYFRTAFNGRWKEADGNELVLEDVNPGIFGIFLDWLYTQNPPDTIGIWENIYETISSEKPPERGPSLQLQACVFGDRFLVAQVFRHAAHNEYTNTRSRSGCPRYKDIIFAYTNFREDNPIRKLMVDRQCVYWTAERDDDDEVELRNHLPYEFLLEVMLRFKSFRGRKTAHLDRCDYHLHSSDEERALCQKSQEKKGEKR